jgi:hypothetical protein
MARSQTIRVAHVAIAAPVSPYGRIDQAFFERTSATWRAQQEDCLRDIALHQAADQDYLDEGTRLLEIAHQAKKLFDEQSIREAEAPAIRTIELGLERR